MINLPVIKNTCYYKFNKVSHTRILIIITTFFCLNISAKPEGKYVQINNLLAKGDTLLFDKKYDEARTYFNRGLKVSEEHELEYESRYCKYKLGFSYIVQERDSLALNILLETLNEFFPINSKDSILYLLLKAETELLDDSIRGKGLGADKYLAFFNNTTLPYSDWEQKRAYYLLAGLLTHEKEHQKAIGYYKKAVKVKAYALYTDDLAKTGALFEYNLLREFQKAIDEGLYLFSHNNGFVSGDVYDKVGKSFYILERYEEALNVYNTLLTKALKEDDIVRIFRTYVKIGHTYVLSGETDKAYEFYRKAYDIAHNENVTNTHLLLSVNSMIFYYSRIGKLIEAGDYVHEAVSLLERDNHITQELAAVKWCMAYFIRVEDYSAQIRLANNFARKYKEQDLELWSYYHQMLTSKHYAEYRIWQSDSTNIEYLEKSYKGFHNVVRLKRKSMRNLSTRSSRLRDINYMKLYYANAFISGHDLFSATSDSTLLDSLYSYVENAKAIIFQQNLQESKAVRNADIPDHLVKQEGRLRGEISTLREALADIGFNNDNSREKLLERLMYLTEKYDSLLNAFNEDYPTFYSEKYSKEENTREEIVNYLEEGQVLINYYIEEGRLFAFFFSKEESVFKEISVSDDFEENILIYRTMLERKRKKTPENYEEELGSFVHLSHTLYNSLLQPFEEYIKGKRLLIIPHAELNFIPFETLVTDTTGDGGNGYGGLNYLVSTNPVSVLYSSIQLSQKREAITNSSKCIGFAPDYSVSDGEWAELKGAEKEVEQIFEYFEGRSILAKEASKKKFLAEAPDYEIVHLALHTELSRKDPMFSKLLFNSTGMKGVEPLFIHNLFGFMFKTKLMVLSGCNSGYGRLQKTEGVMSLARIFFYCGINNIIVTQWAIADKSSSALMNKFYKYLSEGNSVDIALQKAKIDYLETTDPLMHHPYYWSGYVLVGDPISSEVDKGNVKYFVYIALVLFIILLVLYSSNRRT